MECGRCCVNESVSVVVMILTSLPTAVKLEEEEEEESVILTLKRFECLERCYIRWDHLLGSLYSTGSTLF